MNGSWPEDCSDGTDELISICCNMREFFTFEWYPYTETYCESYGIDGSQDEVINNCEAG